MQPSQTSGEWEAEVAVCQETVALQEAVRMGGEMAGQNETQQPASANEGGKSRMDNNQGNIQQQ